MVNLEEESNIKINKSNIKIALYIPIEYKDSGLYSLIEYKDSECIE